jgi:uncharacterized protein (TIGR02466 family)
MKDITPDLPYYNNIEIFPELVWQINLGDSLDKKGKKVIRDSLKDSRINPLGNLTTNDNYLLEHKDLKGFKEELTKHACNFFDYTHHPEHPESLYITQSWANLTKQNDSHGTHSHANSIISAVYYVKACDDDLIVVYHPSKGHFSQILVHTDTYDKYNALSWRIPVKENDLILFKSTLHHSVPMKEHAGDRISLAFNTFYNNLGSAETLTQLKLNDWEQLGWSRIPKDD